MKYRKKPVVIDAIRCAEAIYLAAHDYWKLPEWLWEENAPVVFCPDCIHIRTLEGDMRAELNDMIIRGVAGEIYPCKPEIFAATYEFVE